MKKMGDVYELEVINELHSTIPWFQSLWNQQKFAYKKRYLFCINRFILFQKARFFSSQFQREVYL